MVGAWLPKDCINLGKKFVLGRRSLPSKVLFYFASTSPRHEGSLLCSGFSCQGYYITTHPGQNMQLRPPGTSCSFRTSTTQTKPYPPNTRVLGGVIANFS